MTALRALTAADLAGAVEGGITCPRFECGLQPESGTHRFDDRSPFQLISITAFRCLDGHEWTCETDGGWLAADPPTRPHPACWRESGRGGAAGFVAQGRRPPVTSEVKETFTVAVNTVANRYELARHSVAGLATSDPININMQ